MLGWDLAASEALNVDVFEYVGLGCTGPRERRERAKSGSWASRLMARGSGVLEWEVMNGFLGKGGYVTVISG